MKLKVHQISQYEQFGFTILPELLNTKQINELQTATDHLEQKAINLTIDTLIQGVFYEVQSASGKKREPAIQPGLLRKITSPSKGHGAFFKLRQNKELLELVKQFGVQNPYCAVDQINFKAPHVGTGFPFHQDGAFIRGEAGSDLSKQGGLNIVIALDESKHENGAFIVIPKSHLIKKATTPSNYDTSTMLENYYEAEEKITITQKPGDAVIFHPWLAHGSAKNTSALRRRLIALWFVGRSPLDSFDKR